MDEKVERRVLSSDRPLHFSAVTLGEIQAGIEITRAQNPRRAEEIEAWADDLAGVWNILAVDAAIYHTWQN